MKRVQVLTTRPFNKKFPLVSLLVRLVQFSKESHIVWYFPDKKVIRDLYLGEFREIDIDTFMENNRIVNMKTLAISDNQYNKLEEYTKSKIGLKFDYFFTLITFLFLQIFRKIGIKFDNPFSNKQTNADFIKEGTRQIDELMVFILAKDIPQGMFNTKDAMDLIHQFSEKY